MGSLTRKICGCGKPAKSQGLDHKGRKLYRSQCFSCREEARSHKKGYCEWCFVEASDELKLDIDHIDGNTSNNQKSNLQTLCRPCHMIKTKIFGDHAYHLRQKRVLSQVSNIKHCSYCKKNLELREFSKSVHSSDGYQSWCKECTNAANKRRYEQRKNEPKSITRTSKKCNDCKKTKPVSQFGKKTQSKDKLMPYCKPCWTTRTKKARQRSKK